MIAPESVSQPWLLAADPQGRWAAFAEPPRTLVVARLPEQAAGSSRRWQTTVFEGIASLSASRDGRWLAVGHETSGSLALWAPLDEELSAWIEVSRATLPGASGAIGLTFSPADDSLAVAWDDRLQVLRLDLEELDRLRREATNPAVAAKTPKRIVISSPNEYARYAALLATALAQDLKIEQQMEGSDATSLTNAMSASIERADAIVVIVGRTGWRQLEEGIRLAKRLGKRVIPVQVSYDIQEVAQLHNLAVANVDASGQVLVLSGLQGAALIRALNSTAVNILRSMGVDSTPLLREIQKTYDDTKSRYFNPPSEIKSLGRKLSEGGFRELVSQLGPDELLMGLYENQAPALVATHVSSRARLHELSLSNMTLLGFFAMPRDVANRGWDGEVPIPVKAEKRPMVVVSYVRAYAALARSLVEALEAIGRLDVRYDGHITSGESSPNTVLQWLDQSDALVVLAGPASAQANYSKVELERAQKLNKPVIPIVVEAGRLPSAFASYQAVNVDDDGTPLLLAPLKGRHLKVALHRTALQVIKAVTAV